MAEIAIINAGFKPARRNIEFADIGCGAKPNRGRRTLALPVVLKGRIEKPSSASGKAKKHVAGLTDETRS